jgi:putative two-component system response regulator
MSDTADAVSDLLAADEDLQRQLDAARSQLDAYARDLRSLLGREREKSAGLAAAHEQLRSYAKDLRGALEAERSRARELEQTHIDTLMRLTRAAQYRDEETGGHIQRIAHFARTLALRVGIGPEEAERIYLAAPMHDIGKIGVPDAVLHKPGALNDAEWREMRRHPGIGASLLRGSASPLVETARVIALTHHERWDGTGYPQGLKGDQSPLPGRIVMFVDQYDALRTARRYKPAIDHEKTCEILLEGDGRTLPCHFDPDLLDAFRSIHDEFAAIHDRIRD